MKKLNTLNEEINRMKSLFGESRLYGNLVEQEDDVCKWFKPKQNDAIEILEELISTANMGKINPFFSEEKKIKIEELLEVLKESKESIEKISCTDGIEVICNQENREKIDGGIEIIEEKKESDDAKMVKNELEKLLTLLNEIKQKCVEYDSTKKNSEGGDNKQEEPTTKEVPTELMNCNEVEETGSYGKRGIRVYCDEDKATLVWEVNEDGKSDGLQRTWYVNGQLKREGNYKEDKKEGLWKWYYENGQLRNETNYKEGKEDGLERSWYDNGDHLIDTYYINGNEVTAEEYVEKTGEDPNNTTVLGDVVITTNRTNTETDTEETPEEKDKKDNIEVKDVDKKPTGSGDIFRRNYRTGKKYLVGTLEKGKKNKDGETTFIIKNRKRTILYPERNGFLNDDAKKGVMDALYNLGVDTTNKNINVINDRKFTIK